MKAQLRQQKRLTLVPSTFIPEYILFLIEAANMETESNRRRTLMMIMETSGSLEQNDLLTIESSRIDLKRPQDPHPLHI